jgi:predicted nucleic acid-binding Zn ribbon protein
VESISGVLFRMYRGTERHGPWVVACLQGAWPKLVGARIAAVCTPVEWRDRTLVVEVLDPAWRAGLERVQEDLLERIRTATGGEVLRLGFRACGSPDVNSSRPDSI